MQSPSIQSLIARLNDHGERAPKAAATKLAKLGKKAVPELIAALKTSPNIRIRRWAAYTLGLVDDRRSVAPLKKALKDPNMSVRLLALEALEQVDGSKAGRHLLPLLTDESGGVRIRTINALARLKYKPAVAALKRAAVRDEKNYVRKAAQYAISFIQP